MGYGFVPYLEGEVKKLPKKDQKKYLEFAYCDFDTCKHKDCAAEWADRRRPCPLCKELVLPGEAFYMSEKNEREHAKCVWKRQDEIDRERKAMAKQGVDSGRPE